MKEIASQCCGSCVHSKIENNDLICIQLFSRFSKAIVYRDTKCKCKNGIYKPRNPIKNYEDELLELIIKKVLNCKSISPDYYRFPMSEEIDLIEKMTGKKWDGI